MAGGIGYIAGGVAEGSGGLVGGAFGGEVVVSGDSAEAFLHFADEVGAGAGEALLVAPGGGAVSGVVHCVEAGSGAWAQAGTGIGGELWAALLLAEDEVGGQTGAHASEKPWK